MTEAESDNLELAAFRFVAGEMSPAEAATFEQRLAGDQATREVVCQAVELTQRLVLGEADANAPDRRVPTPTTATPSGMSRWPHSIGWMVTGALAASLAFLLLGPFDPRSDSTFAQQNPSLDRPASKSDSGWLDSQQIDTLALLEMGTATRWEIVPEWPDEFRVVYQPQPISESPITIPDWMLQSSGDPQ